MRIFRKKLTKKQKRLELTLEFLVRLLILSIPLYVILYFQGMLLPLQELVANHVFWLLKSAGFSVIKDGLMIAVRGGEAFGFFISEDCTGWKSMVFLFALIFAVPKTPMKKRLLGLIAGIPLIYLGNLLRIYWVIMIGKAYGAEAALIVHDLFWHLGLVSLVFVIWIIWLFYAGKIGRKSVRGNVFKVFRRK